MTAEQHNLSRILELRDEFRRRDLHFVSITIARGGSRRYPRKNIAPLCGRPLVAWSVLQSLCSHLVTETYVSTDDEVGTLLFLPYLVLFAMSSRYFIKGLTLGGLKE